MSHDKPTAAEVRLRELVATAGWGALSFVGVEFIARIFGKSATGALAVQAAAAEWACGRLGVTWNDPHAAPATGRDIQLRVLRGAGIGAAVGLLVVCFAFFTRGASVALSPPALSQVLLGVATASLVAVRHGLFFRGLVLRAFGGLVPKGAVIAIMAACQGAAAFSDEASLMGVVFGTTLGALLGFVALKERGLVVSVALHGAFSFVMNTLTHGGALDVRALPGFWGGGDDGISGGASACLGLVLVSLGLAYGMSRGRAAVE